MATLSVHRCLEICSKFHWCFEDLSFPMPASRLHIVWPRTLDLKSKSRKTFPQLSCFYGTLCGLERFIKIV